MKPAHAASSHPPADSDALAAAVKRLKLPVKTEDYTPNDWARLNAVTSEWLESWKPDSPADGVNISSGTVTATRFTDEQIDAEEEFDQARTPQEAIAAEAKCRRLEATAQTTTRDRAPRVQALGVRRRICAGGRRRPGARRVVRSTGSPGSSDPDSDGPGEARRSILRRSSGLHVTPGRQAVKS